jgi:hypothetical protein
VADETRAQGALFILNDRLDLAMALGADGVHLGREDMPLAEFGEISPRGGRCLGPRGRLRWTRRGLPLDHKTQPTRFGARGCSTNL